MNIQKVYYYVAPHNELSKVREKAGELNNAASDKVLAGMTPFQTDVFRQHKGVSRYDGMSDYERRQEAQRIAAQERNIVPKIVSALKTDWATVKGEYHTLQREKAGAADRASRLWDYARLAYEKQNARSFLSKAKVDEITKRYGAVEISGDRHALRALVEEGMEVLTERKFTDQDIIKAQDLRDDFKKMYVDLTETRETRELKVQGSILTDKIAHLHDITKQLAGELSKHFEPPKDDNGNYILEQTQQNPIAQLAEGVTISRTVDTDLVTHTSAVMGGNGWDEPDAGDLAAETRAILAQKGYIK